MIEGCCFANSVFLAVYRLILNTEALRVWFFQIIIEKTILKFV